MSHQRKTPALPREGRFSVDGLEYLVPGPHPGHRDWVNLFWNPDYLACAGGSLNGFSLHQSQAGVVAHLFGRQDLREDPRALYVRDAKTGRFWSAGFQPCATKHDDYLVRHGLGYTILESRRDGLATTFRVFVPRGHAGEAWSIEVRNTGPRTRALNLFPAAAVMLDGVNMPYGYISGLTASCRPAERMLFFSNQTRTVVHERYRAFMYSDRQPDRWDCSRDAFLGAERNFAQPGTVRTGQLTNSSAAAEYLVGALQYNVTLKPGQSYELNIVLGLCHDHAEARRMIRKLKDGAAIERAFGNVRKHALQRINGLRLATPDPRLNRLMNVWLKHQLHLMADWARFYFKGFRDTCQDAAGLSVIDPARARDLLMQALTHQRSDGYCPRAFRVPGAEVAAADKHYADSPTWISHATHALLCETGDLSLLKARVPFSDHGDATVWEHNLRALDFLWHDRGRHGLCRIRNGDWNDLIDHAGRKGRGVGIWMSMAFARALKLSREIAAWCGDTAAEKKCRLRHAILCKAIRRHGWDGQWFRYAFTDAGQRIGSHTCREGRVFLNPQTWALLSGVISRGDYACIMEQIEPMLDSPAGPVHHWPPFTAYDDDIGQLTGTPPGFFTNGNVYCHAASFKIAADLDAGRADAAYETLQRILPAADRSEPFAQANGYVGPTALRALKHVSDDPWRTGTVAWHFLNVVDQLLGFRRTLKGFSLDPRLPGAWKKETRYTRPFRGTRFEITIRRGSEPGLWMEGVKQACDFVAVPPGGLSRKRVQILYVLPLQD